MTVNNRKITIKNTWVSSGNTYPIKKSAKYLAIHFSSSAEFIDYVLDDSNHNQNAGTDASREYGKNSDNCDTTTFEQAEQFLRFGSPAHAKKFKSACHSFDISAVSSQTFTQIDEYDVSGEMVDIGEFVAGEPDCFYTPESEPDTPIIKIACSINARGGVSQTSFMNRGAAILSLIDQIESSGIATVELTLFTTYTCNKGAWSWSFPVKQAGDLVDLDKLAFLFCSSSALRRFGWRVTESLPIDSWAKATSWGYGRPNVSANGVGYECTTNDDFLDDMDLVFCSNENLTKERAIELVKTQAMKSPNIKKFIT